MNNRDKRHEKMRELDKRFKRHRIKDNRTHIHYEQIVVRSKSSMITFVSSVLLRLPAAHTNAESVHLIRQTTPRNKRFFS